MNIKLAAQEHMLPGEDLIEKWVRFQDLGFDGIELLGQGGGRFAARRAELTRARDAGVVFSSVCVAMDHFIGDFDADRRRSAIAGMKDLLSVIGEVGGVGAITPAAYALFSRALPPYSPPRSPEQDREVLLDGLGQLGEHAAAAGSAVLLEPLNRYEDYMVNTLDDAASYCRELGSDSIRVMADFFHMNIEERDPAGALRAAAPWVGHVQVADSSRLEPGTGHLDFAGGIAALTEAGYDGWYALECTLSGPGEDVLGPAAAYLRAEAGR